LLVCAEPGPGRAGPGDKGGHLLILILLASTNTPDPIQLLHLCLPGHVPAPRHGDTPPHDLLRTPKLRIAKLHVTHGDRLELDRRGRDS
jgi:hypothetical protein